MNPISPTCRRLIAASAAGLIAGRDAHPSLAQDVTASPPSVRDDGSLPSMLARAYDPIPDGGTGPSTLFTYGNIARQLEVRGLRGPDAGFHDRDRTSEWLDGIDGLYVDDVFLQRTMLEELWGQLGFDPSQLDQTMTIGDAPGITRFYRGRFNGGLIERALEVTGYERVQTERRPVLTIGQDGDYSLANSIQGIVLNAYNNIAVIDNAYVIAGPYLTDVESALAGFGGSAATLANNRAVQTLLAAVGEEIVSAVVLDGATVSVGSLPDVALSGAPAAATSAMIAPASYVLFGLTPGSMPSRYTDEDNQLQGDNDDTAPRATFVIALLLGSDEEAADAVPIVKARLAEGRSVVTGEPYATLFESWEVKAAAGSPVLKIRVGGERVGRRWLQLLFARDLAFIYTA